MGMPAADVSLCMIVKDEERVLGRCLSSVSAVVSEMIVVDTGSSDRTRDIARGFGAVVVSIPWKNDFAHARNVSLALASKPWILVLDADEEWSPGATAAQLRELLVSAERLGVQGFNLRLLSAVGTGEEYVTDSVCRLFRNDDRIRFSGALHEEAASSIQRRWKKGLAEAGGDLFILHSGYLDRVIAEKQKSKRNLAILSAVIERSPDHPYWLYALGTEYYQLGQYADALRFFERLKGFTAGSEGYLSDLLLKMAFAYKETGNRETAVVIADEALRKFPDFPDLLELRAMLALEEGDVSFALAVLRRAFEAGDRSAAYSSSSGAGTYRTVYLIGQVHEQRMEREEAATAYREALRLRPGYGPAVSRLRELEDDLR
jgi:glycosyltransferase involved in cell wall biosynthesis